MTNLTEQWKNGELPDGFYWCDVDIYEDGNITKQIESFIHHHPVFYWETSIVRVIELAPSFSEYKSMQEENTKLKELLKECVEANQSLRKQPDEEKAKNRIDYYNGSPMDFLDECERAMKKNKIYKNWIKNINTELLTSELRKTEEGNKFIVGILAKIDQVLGE